MADFWTTATAVGGFVIAALTAVWTIYRDLLDRHKVEVYASEFMLSQAPSEVSHNAWDANETCIIITATNVGRRPVTMTGFHFKLANTTKHAIIFYDPKDPRSRCFDPMPKELQEGQVARAFIPSKDMTGNEIEYAYVIDTVGRQWKSKRFPLRVPKKKKVEPESASEPR